MTEKTNRKLILHIGAHKTGSSAIQHFLLRQKAELARKGWFFVERPGRPTNWGHMFKVKREADGAKFPLAPVIMGNMLNLMDSGLPDVIFSAEDLFFLENADIATFAEAMKKRFAEITVIAYVRRQDLMALSQWLQGGKTVQSALVFGGLKGPLENINPFMLSYLDYSGRLAAWQRAMPNATLKIRVYDRKLFPNRDVIEDFIAASGLDIKPDGHEEDVNASIGATTVRFVYLLRAAGLLQRPVELALANGQIPITDDRILPSRAEAEAFVAMFADSNARLAQMMGTAKAFSEDFSTYPDAAVVPPLDPAYVQNTLLTLLVDAIRKVDPLQVLPLPSK